ncbi:MULTISPECIES: DUF4097 family beta strand repeat-containing protein [Streptomyces]|uniref:DUF4097 family beta strand repeat-containing protein n=1 Tax=Streptomyces TaxID=1883 RepID=UPI000515EA4C|nr:DUF4097 family beta strand repeat-containing protein [Streptomyces sp. CNS654]WDT89619.1 DUF4097 family beta strand repeat protein [Streptomyces sp. SCSIO-PteL053]
MFQLLRGLGLVAVSGTAVVSLASCGIIQGETYEDDSTLSGKITSVRLDNGSGGVTVNGVKDGALALHRKIEFRGDRPQGATHRIEDGVLILGGCGNRCSVNYTVDVPAGIPVSGEVSSGAIRLAQVGSVEVTTSSGRVEMDGVTGTVQVRTSNGQINGTGIKGDSIQAQTSNGRINLTPDTPADVRAQTSNGAVTLTVPKASYKVTVDSNNGDQTIDVPSDPAGEYELGVRTSNGDITVRNS